MYTVKHAAEIVGVSTSTLRAWERRYGTAPPRRSDAGYRLYDEQAVRDLVLMQSLIAEGMTAAAAAEELRRRGGLASGFSADIESLVPPADEIDQSTAERVLRIQFAAAPFEDVVDDWLLPALERLGVAWADGDVTVAGEHVVSEAARRVLAAQYAEPQPVGEGPPVAIGLPPGSRHELGLLAFASAARRRSLPTTYLGADVPVVSWASIAASDCAAAVLAISRRRDVGSFAAVHAAIRAVAPELPIAVGGKLQDEAPEDCLRLGHRIGSAAQELATELGDAA
jgi:DNA-binding transcriptional MerR regulator